MPAFAEILAGNAAYVPEHPGPLPAIPTRHMAIVTCMDARLRVFSLAGLHEGDAHVIRNAGGVVTDDVVRSLTISQQMLGTTSVAVIAHTECGLLNLTDEQFHAAIEEETGDSPEWSTLGFADVDASVKASVERVRALPYLPHRDQISGFVFDVNTGVLRRVS